MKLSKHQLKDVMNEYISREILPASTSESMWDRFTHGMKVGIVQKSANKMIDDLDKSPYISFLGIIDEEGCVDFTLLYDAAMESMEQVGEVEVSGMRFKKEDIELLHTIAKKYGHNHTESVN